MMKIPKQCDPSVRGRFLIATCIRKDHWREWVNIQHGTHLIDFIQCWTFKPSLQRFVPLYILPYSATLAPEAASRWRDESVFYAAPPTGGFLGSRIWTIV